MKLYNTLHKVAKKVQRDGVIQTLDSIASHLRPRFTNELRRLYVRSGYEPAVCADQFIRVDPRKISDYQLSNPYCRNSKRNSDIPLHKLEKGRFCPTVWHGISMGGCWDLYRKPHKYDRVYRGLRDHYLEGKDWRDTEYITTYILREQIRNEAGYAQRKIRERERRWRSISQNGYLTQYEQGNKRSNVPIRKRPWEVTVNIGRNGKLIFNNTGHHRLAISKLQQINPIPVAVVVRHKRWESIRRRIRGLSSIDQVPEPLHQHLSHPDIRPLHSIS